MAAHQAPAPATDLPPAALAYRAAHGIWAVAQLTALAWVWWSAIRRERGPGLRLAVGFLAIQGIGLVAGRGDCPMTAVQHRLGDRVPLFGLFLPPRAAKAAVPVLAAVTGAAFLAVLLRPPQRHPPDVTGIEAA
jgi:hypothetical protein